MIARENARIVAQRIADRRFWGDLRNDALAKRYYDTAIECIIESMMMSDADMLEQLLEAGRAR